MKAITVIELQDLSTMGVSAAKTFPATPEGEREARETFNEWVESGLGEGIEPDFIDSAWHSGLYEIGEGGVAVVRST